MMSAREKRDIEINPLFVGLLEENGLDTFEGVMGCTGGETFKDLGFRSVSRLRIGNRVFYLKRHRGADRPWGKVEWDNIQAFVESGIPTVTAVVFGRRKEGGRYDSFLLTEGLEGASRLEIFAKENYIVPSFEERLAGKRALIERLALLARKMHDAGFFHRDFYLTHILARPVGARVELYIFDLQRVIKGPLFKRRWQRKDLACLNFAAKPSYTTLADRMRFIKAYLGNERLSAGDKRLIRAVLAKTERIRAHDLKACQKKLFFMTKKRAEKNLLRRVLRRFFYLLNNLWPSGGKTAMSERRRFLVVSTTGLGDTLLSTPAIRALKERYPGSHVAVLVDRRRADI
ncbi:MAG: hypothetical protein HY880_09340, partial [Deltaproteobacteria bacterium]|nr:hypothetical protein [Deltaproteobacteria bacterium]